MRTPPLVVALVLLLGCAGSTRTATESPIAAVHVDDAGPIALTTPAGEALLARNLGDADAIPLLRHFESQRHGAYCGVASSVIALNTLGVVAPASPVLGPFRYFTQELVIGDEATNGVVPAATVNTQGMTLDQLGGILRAHGVEATVTHAEDVPLDAFRALLRDNVERAGDLVLVNYHRPTVGQEGGGHISPVAAYDEASDRVLVLDVAQYRYPPVFVRVEALWNAARAVDSTSGLSRGVVEVSLRAADPSTAPQR